MAYQRGSKRDRQQREAQISQDRGQLVGPLPLLVGQDRIFGDPGQVPDYDWPNPIPKRRSRDYTFAGSTVEYIGQDRIYGDPGQAPAYDWQLAPRGGARARDYTWVYFNSLLYVEPEALPPGLQVVALPPTGPRRLRADSWTFLNPNLFAEAEQLPPGVQFSALPPKAPRRLRDYTWLHQVDVQLIGQDRVYGDPGQAPAYDWQPPPKGPKRSRDYTFVHPSDVQLIGQDVIYGAPGQAPAYDWIVPKPYERAINVREPVNMLAGLLTTVVVERNYVWTPGAPQMKWRFGEPLLKWQPSEPRQKWRVDEARE